MIFAVQSSSSVSKIVAEHKFEFQFYLKLLAGQLSWDRFFCTKMFFQVIGAAACIGEDIKGKHCYGGYHSWVRRALR